MDESNVKQTPQEHGWGEAFTPVGDEHPEPAIEYGRYGFEGELGEIGPELPAQEAVLFGQARERAVGERLGTMIEVEVTIESEVKIKPIKCFEDAGLHPVVLSNLAKCDYINPMPIQAYCIPAVLSGKDVLAVSQTGSGKTAAYLVPMISKLMGKAHKVCGKKAKIDGYDERVDAVQAKPVIMIVCPTRELAVQIFQETCRLTYRSGLRPCLLYGGAPRKNQMMDLKKGCDILIGTPGRLKDVAENDPKWLTLKKLKYTVLDEADELVQSDWDEATGPILLGTAAQQDDDHQFLLFSATFPKETRSIAREYLADDHFRVRIGRIGAAQLNVLQIVIYVEGDLKQQALYDLLNSTPPCRTLVFCNSNHAVDAVDDYLWNNNFPVASIHSNRTQYERESSMRAFKDGKCPILVASAVAARGIDIPHIMHVINYDLPSTMHGGIHEYVHRIGRTGRMGHYGQATSFFNNERNEDIAEPLVKVLMEANQEIPDFLEQYKPADGIVLWDEDVSDEEEPNGATGAEIGGDEWNDSDPTSGLAAGMREVSISVASKAKTSPNDTDDWGAAPATPATPAVAAW